MAYVVRPSGSDSYPPAPGTVVHYVFAKAVNDLESQARKRGWRILGKIGDTSHLRKHGGHTPYRAGSKRGIVWAIDIDTPHEFEQYLVALCKSNYDTTWIRFFNINNRQYDNAGNYLGYSGDGHFHCEVQDGYENKSVTLIDEYGKGIDVALTQAEIKAIAANVWAYGVTNSAFESAKDSPPVTTHSTHEAIVAALNLPRVIAKVEERITAAINSIDTGAPNSQPTIDYALLAKSIVDEFHSRNTQ